jgi:GWxTD domain-containing protein
MRPFASLIALLLAAWPAVAQEWTWHQPAPEAERPAERLERLETELARLQRETSERKAFSFADTRRPALARRILKLDSDHAGALEEQATEATLRFVYWRDRAGGYEAGATRGAAGRAERYRAEAERLLRRALAGRPSAEARTDLYRRLLRLHVETEDVDALERDAEAFRRSAPSNPDALLYAGFAAYKRDDLALAERHFEAALEAMLPEGRARLLALDDLIRPDEVAGYEADSAGFSERFWRSRDPRLLTPQNERRLEHLARLATADLLFYDGQTGQRGWDGLRGEVVTRYGLPNGHHAYTAQNFRDKDFSAYDRWTYDGFTLLFEDAFRSGDYQFWSSATGTDDVIKAGSLFRTQPEAYRYRPERPIELPVVAAAFRGEGGQTDLVVRYAVPLDSLAVPGQPLGLEAGAFLLDSLSRPQAEARRTVGRTVRAEHVAPGGVPFFADGFVLGAAPGPYTLAVEAEQASTKAVGLYRVGVEVPDLSGAALQMSDLLLAGRVEEAAGEAVPRGVVRRGGLDIVPLPWAVVPLGAPVYLYAETYGLARAPDGLYRYEIEAALDPVDERGRLARVAGALTGGLASRAPAGGLAVTFEATSDLPDAPLHPSLDLAGQAPGRYRLRLAIRDLVAGSVVRTERSVRLVAP